MAQADGTILIDTKIRTDGVKPGAKEIEAACKRSAAIVQKLGTNIEKSTVSMVDLENKSSGTANSVKALSSDLDSTSEATQKLGNNSDIAADDIQKVGDKAKKASSPIDELGDKSESAAQKLQNAGDKIKTVGTGLIAGITAPLALAGKSMIEAASDFDENLNKVNVAFGNSSEAVTAWAENATKQFGLSKNQALEATSLFGDMGTAMGLTQSDAADMSTSLAGLAGDLASFKNIDIEQAMTALSGVFTGETESLKQLGIVMTETNLEEFAARTGKVYSEMGQAEKVQLRYNYVMEMTKNAQGDYARTSDGTANSLRTFQGSVDNLSIALGKNLLPIITPIINKMTEMVNKFSEMSPNTQKFILIMAGVAAAIGPVLLVVGQLVSTVGKISPLFSKAGGIISGFSKILGVLTGPVGLVAAAIAALVAVFAYLFTTNESFRESIMNTVLTLGESFKPVLDALLPVLTNLAVTMGETLGKVLQALAPVLARIIELAGALLAKLGEFIAWALENVLPVLQPIIEFLVNAVTSFFDTISEVASGILEALSGVIDFVVGVFSGDWDKAWNGIKTIFSGIWKAISSLFSGIWTTLKDIVKGGVEFIKNLINSVWNGIKSLTSTVWNAIKIFLSSLWNGIKSTASNVFNNIRNALSSVWSSIRSTASSVWNSIRSTLSNIWNGLRNTVNSTFNSIKSKITSIWNSVKSVTSSVWNGIKNTIRGAINGIIGGINGLIRGMVNGLNAVIRALNRLHIKIPDWVPGFGGRTFGFNIGYLSAPQIPYLASGAVIPPNKEFLAVLGDQKSGNNIEAPESLIRRIVREESGNGVQRIEVPVYLNRKQIAKAIVDEGKLMRIQTGKNPFELA